MSSSVVAGRRGDRGAVDAGARAGGDGREAAQRLPVPGAAVRVVVAGTSFGRVYLDAVGSDLVGILARGSDYSKQCAASRGVPLYTSVDEVPDVDVACVVLKSGALGGPGTEIANARRRWDAQNTGSRLSPG